MKKTFSLVPETNKNNNSIYNYDVETIDFLYATARKSKPLSISEEQALAVLVQNGDEAAYHKIVNANLLFAISEAKKFENKGVAIEDLIQDAYVGLCNAAKKFVPEKGKFITFAGWYIRKELFLALNLAGIIRLSEDAFDLLCKANAFRNQFFEDNGVMPRVKDIAEALHVDDISRLIRILEANHRIDLESSVDSKDVEGDSDRTWYDVIDDPDQISVESLYELEEAQVIIDSILKACFKSRDIEVFYAVELDGLKPGEVAEMYNLTTERVRQIRRDIKIMLGRNAKLREIYLNLAV